MALSLLQGYSSEEERERDEGDGSSGSSDSEDDGITVTIDRRVLEGKKAPPARRNLSQSRHQHKPPRGLKRERPVPENEQRFANKKVSSPPAPAPPVSTLDLPHWDLGQNTREEGGVPLPSSISDMFTKDQEAERAQDDPALHEGRLRSFSHCANSWASYVYVGMEGLDLVEARDLLVEQLDMEPIANPHLSLSRVVSLRHHWLDPLVASLTHSLGQERRFPLSLDKLQVYVNDEGTRTFVGLTAAAGWPQLSRLSRRVDTCLAEYSLPPFYRPPSFHCSLAWCLGDRRSAILPQLQKLSLKLVDCIEDEVQMVTSIECKAGNKMFKFPLI